MAEDLDDTDLLMARSPISRRALLRGAGIGAVVLALGGGGAAFFLRRARIQDSATAAKKAEQSGQALLEGKIAYAVKLAGEARGLDPQSIEVRNAYLRARSVDLLDGDGTAQQAVGLLDEARELGAHGTPLIVVSICSAVGIKNDRITEKILAEQRDENTRNDGYFALAMGAGFDLTSESAAIAWYEFAATTLQTSLLAQLRHARSLLFGALLSETDAPRLLKLAGAILDKLPDDRAETTAARVIFAKAAPLFTRDQTVLAPFIEAAHALELQSSTVPDLPRCLRLLAAASALYDPDTAAGQASALDAVLDDVDTPLAAVIAGRIALATGDRMSAKGARDCALRMREELPVARIFGARLALAEGDMAHAKELLLETPDKSLVDLVTAIDAYETGDLKLLLAAEKESKQAVSSWPLLPAAKALLENAAAPSSAPALRADGALDPGLLDRSMRTSVPWADIIAYDAAVALKQDERAKAISSRWTKATMSTAQAKRKNR